MRVKLNIQWDDSAAGEVPGLIREVERVGRCAEQVALVTVGLGRVELHVDGKPSPLVYRLQIGGQEVRLPAGLGECSDEELRAILRDVMEGR